MITARASVATTMIGAAQAVYEPAKDRTVPELIALPRRVRVKYLARPADDEDDWLAVAMERQSDGQIQYVIVKGSSQAKAPAAELDFSSA